MKRIEDSEKFYCRALAMKEKLLDPDHPDVAVTLNNLAILCRSQGRREEAERLYQRCLSILGKVFGPGHPKIAACLANYARLLCQMGRNAETAGGLCKTHGQRHSVCESHFIVFCGQAGLHGRKTRSQFLLGIAQVEVSSQPTGVAATQMQDPRGIRNL